MAPEGQEYCLTWHFFFRKSHCSLTDIEGLISSVESEKGNISRGVAKGTTSSGELNPKNLRVQSSQLQ